MHTRFNSFVAVGIMILILSTVAGAQPHKCKAEAGEKHPLVYYSHILKEAGATTDQLKQLRHLVFSIRMKCVDLHATARKAKLKLHFLHTVEDVDEATLHSAIDAFFSAKAVLVKHLATGFVKIRQVLGAKIWKKVHGQFMDHFHKIGHAMVHGHQQKLMGGFGHRPAGGQNPAHPGMLRKLHELHRSDSHMEHPPKKKQ